MLSILTTHTHTNEREMHISELWEVRDNMCIILIVVMVSQLLAYVQPYQNCTHHVQ